MMSNNLIQILFLDFHQVFSVLIQPFEFSIMHLGNSFMIQSTIRYTSGFLVEFQDSGENHSKINYKAVYVKLSRRKVLSS